MKISARKIINIPVCRIVGIACCATGALLEAAIGAYKGPGSGETTLLRQLLANIDSGNILLGDALCGSFFTLAQCVKQGIDVVFEQRGARKLKTDFRRVKRLGPKDHIISLERPAKRTDWLTEEKYQHYPEKLFIRETYVDRKLLITTLEDPVKYPKGEPKKVFTEVAGKSNWIFVILNRFWEWRRCLAKHPRWQKKKSGCVFSPTT